VHEHKAALSEKAASTGKPQAWFAETYRTAFAFIANPCNLRHSPRPEDRRAVLRLVFAGHRACQRGSG
jgi:site-specific DNA recombinase